MNHRLLLPLVALALGVLAGCSTPQARIDRNPEYFAALSADAQEKIKRGEIALGFEAEMVRLALGEPDRVVTRLDETGQGEAWIYSTYETADGRLLYRGFYHRYYGSWYGRGWGGHYPYFLDYPARRERERFRVSFRDGKVVAVESQT